MLEEITKKRENKKKDHRDKKKKNNKIKENKRVRKKKNQKKSLKDRPEEEETEMVNNDIDLEYLYLHILDMFIFLDQSFALTAVKPRVLAIPSPYSGSAL